MTLMKLCLCLNCSSCWRLIQWRGDVSTQYKIHFS